MIIHAICPESHTDAAKLNGLVRVSEVPLLQHMVVARPKVQQVIQGKECHLAAETNTKLETHDIG